MCKRFLGQLILALAQQEMHRLLLFMRHSMVLSQAPLIQIRRVEPQRLQSTAIVLAFIRSIGELSFLRMEIALADVRPVEVLVADVAVEEKSEAVDFVEDFFPAHVSCLFEVEEEFLDVEGAVDDVFDDDAAFVVDEDAFFVGFCANEVFLLVHCE